jgi:hypothetical protein
MSLRLRRRVWHTTREEPVGCEHDLHVFMQKMQTIPFTLDGPAHTVLHTKAVGPKGWPRALAELAAVSATSVALTVR